MKGMFTVGLFVLLLAATTAKAQSLNGDRVYTGDQTSNTVSIIDPATQKLLGIIRLNRCDAEQPHVQRSAGNELRCWGAISYLIGRKNLLKLPGQARRLSTNSALKQNRYSSLFFSVSRLCDCLSFNSSPSSAFLNPRIASPSPLPSSGSFFGPKTTSAIRKITIR